MSEPVKCKKCKGRGECRRGQQCATCKGAKYVLVKVGEDGKTVVVPAPAKVQ